MLERKNLFTTVQAILLLAVLAVTALAEFEPWESGARGYGMGGAMFAESGIESLSYNPAGILNCQDSLLLSNVDQYGLGIARNFFGGKIQIKSVAIGAAYNRLFDPELEYLEQSFQVSGALAPKENINLGGTLRYGTLKSLGGDGKAIVGDLGLLWQPYTRVQVGLVAQNAVASTNYNQGYNEIPQCKLVGGVSVHLANQLSVTANLTNLKPGFKSDDWRIGVEKWYSEQLAIRAGWKEGDFTAGLTIKNKGFEVDYAYQPHNLGDNHLLALKYNFRGGF